MPGHPRLCRRQLNQMKDPTAAAGSFMVVLTGITSHTRDTIAALARRTGRQTESGRRAAVVRRLQVRLPHADIAKLVMQYEAGARTTDLAKQFGVHATPFNDCSDARVFSFDVEHTSRTSGRHRTDHTGSKTMAPRPWQNWLPATMLCANRSKSAPSRDRTQHCNRPRPGSSGAVSAWH
jgi:hypothetical protein